MRGLFATALAIVLGAAGGFPAAAQVVEVGGWLSSPQSPPAPLALPASSGNGPLLELPTLRAEGVVVGMAVAPRWRAEMVVERSTLVNSLGCRGGPAGPWRCDDPSRLAAMTWITGALYLNRVTDGSPLRLGAGAGPAFAQYTFSADGLHYEGGGALLAAQAFVDAHLGSWKALSLTASVRWMWLQVPLRVGTMEQHLLLPLFRAGLSVAYTL